MPPVPAEVSSLAERLVPRRLGPSFRWLWSASLATNMGDGILLAAAPLLIASLTTDPFPVATSVFLQRLPWLLFGLLAGAAVDRVDRRRLSVVVALLRAAVVGVLVMAVVIDALSVGIVYLVAFLLGSAETFADNAASTLVADTVPPGELGIANARLVGSLMVTNQLVGPPVGAFLFGIGRVVPFAGYVMLMGAAAVLVGRVRLRPIEPPSSSRRAIRRDIADGVVWLWRHPPVRTLALTITAFNVTYGAAMAIFVLYATEVLGIGDLGFGLLLSATAIGGVVGAGAYGALERRVSLGSMMRVGLIVETLTHLGLALSRSAWLSGAVMFAFGVHAAVWGTTSTTVRQRAVPSRLLGRVGSVYMLGSLGGIAIGTLLGGALAERFGLLAPFWFAFVGSAIATAGMWRSFPLIAHAAESGPGAEEG